MDFKELAEDLLDKEDYDKLLELCEQEISSNPNNPDGYLYKINCIEDSDEIDALYDKIYELDPSNFETNWRKSEKIYNNTKDIKKVYEYFDNLISQHPDLSNLYALEAKILCLLHSLVDKDIKIDQKLIIKLCEKTLSLDINNAEAYEYLGDAFYIYGNDSPKEKEQAIKYYKKYLEFEPKDFDIHSEVAECIKLTKNLDAAIEYFDNLIENYPDSYEPYYYKAELLASELLDYDIDNDLTLIEDTKNQIEDLIQKALELEPENSDLYDDISDIYEFQMEDKESALKMVKKALEYDKFESSDYFNERIEKLEKEIETESNNQNSSEFTQNNYSDNHITVYENNNNKTSFITGLILIAALIFFAIKYLL